MTLMERRRALMGASGDPFTVQALIKSINNGSYSTKYGLGDIVKLNGTTYGDLQMQIVGFDVDELSDGSGNNATVTLVCNKATFDQAWTTKGNNAGGYPLCTLRTYLNSVVAQEIQNIIGSDHLAMVKKSSYGPANTVNPSNNDPRSTLWSDELVWIPSAREYGRTDRENSGPIYSVMTKNIESRYQLRTTYSRKTGTVDIILANGTYGTDYGINNRPNRIGFCIK